MGQVTVTLDEIFGVSVTGFWQGCVPTLEASEAISALRTRLLHRLPGIRWPAVLAEISQQAKGMFDFDLVDILAGAWSKCRELAKYSDRQKYPVQQTYLVPLAKHTLNSTYHPFLEILINDNPVGKVVFDVMLSLTVEGFVLTVQDATIKKVLAGSCQGKGTIALGRAVLIEKTLAAIRLPGSIDLGKGIRIAAAT
jgi:hypothetical protein